MRESISNTGKENLKKNPRITKRNDNEEFEIRTNILV